MCDHDFSQAIIKASVIRALPERPECSRAVITVMRPAIRLDKRCSRITRIDLHLPYQYECGRSNLALESQRRR